MNNLTGTSFDFAFFGGSKWFCLFVNKNAENEY